MGTIESNNTNERENADMKAPKYIVDIARQQVERDSKEYDFIARNQESWVKSNVTELMNVRNALLNGTYYTSVESVSKSGMSRVIKIKYIKDNKLHGVSELIYRLSGCDKNRRISGCGMDMLFAAQYNLFQTLCPNHKYQDKMQRYNDL